MVNETTLAQRGQGLINKEPYIQSASHVGIHPQGISKFLLHKFFFLNLYLPQMIIKPIN